MRLCYIFNITGQKVCREVYGIVSRTLTDLFMDNPDAELIEVVGYEDCKLLGLSSDGHKLRIFDNDLASRLAQLPNATTVNGHITAEGYHIYAQYNIVQDSHKASVYRLA